MAAYLIQQAAGFRLDDIYTYTKNNWGKPQADKYIKGLFQRFDDIASRSALSKPIPAEFGVDGFFSHYEQHYIYWKILATEQIGIVTVLHQRMHQIERFKGDFGLADSE